MNKVLIIVAVVLGIAATACAGTEDTASSGGASNGLSSNSDNPPVDDVSITKCSEGEFGLADIGVEITNNSSKRSNYVISLNLEDAAGTKVGEATAISNNIEPGQAAIEDAFGTGEGFSTCKIKEVSRSAS